MLFLVEFLSRCSSHRLLLLFFLTSGSFGSDVVFNFVTVYSHIPTLKLLIGELKGNCCERGHLYNHGSAELLECSLKLLEHCKIVNLVAKLSHRRNTLRRDSHDNLVLLVLEKFEELRITMLLNEHSLC